MTRTQIISGSLRLAHQHYEDGSQKAEEKKDSEHQQTM